MRRKDNLRSDPRPRQGSGSVLLSLVAVCGLVGGVGILWSEFPLVGAVMALVSAGVLLSQYDYYWRGRAS